jgi:hypothetical protein
MGQPPAHLRAYFPKITCIAWVAGETSRLWWPWASPPQGYWPSGVTRNDTVDGFVAAFGTVGYVRCEDGGLEIGFEKLAIYVGSDGLVKHMARQNSSGTWSSKLGKLEDVEHETLEMIECKEYGSALAFVKRPTIVSLAAFLAIATRLVLLTACARARPPFRPSSTAALLLPSSVSPAVSSISPVAILMTVTAFELTSVGRF